MDEALRTISTLAITFGFAVSGLAGFLTPIFSLVKAIEGFRHAPHKKGVIILRVLLALAAWLVLSFGMLFMLFVFVYSSAHVRDPKPADEAGASLFMLSLALIYGLACYGLVRLVAYKRQV